MSLVVCALVITFFGVVLTGPAGMEWLEKRRVARLALVEHPAARVVYLPSACCRPNQAEPVSLELSDDTVAHFPLVAATERTVLVLVTLSGSWGMCVSRLDIQKRMFLDTVPEHIDSKAVATAIVDHMRARRG